MLSKSLEGEELLGRTPPVAIEPIAHAPTLHPAAPVVPYTAAPAFTTAAGASLLQQALATLATSLVKTHGSSADPDVQHTSLQLLVAAWELATPPGCEAMAGDPAALVTLANTLLRGDDNPLMQELGLRLVTCLATRCPAHFYPRLLPPPPRPSRLPPAAPGDLPHWCPA